MELLEVTQRKLEAYEKVLLARRDEVQAASVFNRLIIEAAQAGGFVEGLPDDLGDAKPWQVIQWTQDILEHVATAKAPPSEGE